MSDDKFRDLQLSDSALIIEKPPGPRSRELLQKQDQTESAAVSYPKAIPVAFEEGKGATLKDVDGNIYIDFFAGAGVLNTGHCNPEIVEAAKAQMSKLTHNLDFPTPIRAELVDELLSLLPAKLRNTAKLLFVAPTGSDTVESAVKLAKFNTGRIGMISFEGAYHGMTAGAISLTANKSLKENLMPMLPEVHFLPYAYCYRCPFGKESSDCGLECARYLEHVLEDPKSGIVDPAAIIIEAVQGEGGSLPAPDEFLREVRRLSGEYCIPLIVDEIQAGMSRTGKMWACQHSGITPDIMTVSKGIGGGLPLSVLVFDEELDVWEKGAHVGTFRGNVVAVAAGVAALRFIKKHKLWKYAARLGEDVFLPRLRELQDESRFIGDTRGKGLMLGAEFVMDKKTKRPWTEFAKDVRKACYRRGLIIEIGGHFSNVVRFMPPLVITRELAEAGLEIFADAVKEVEDANKDTAVTIASSK
ncbi:MAG: aminotransferase class III-fold pyridoxal phosphate-dependent enzyme [Candidatus Thorarchaeota archaeon]|nr:aminotransferase class III-fold pyridoxal phosphate-dependent enzyme [Candidatus Thorarchaeota archaeon]